MVKNPAYCWENKGLDRAEDYRYSSACDYAGENGMPDILVIENWHGQKQTNIIDYVGTDYKSAPAGEV